MISGYVGWTVGRRMNQTYAKPEFRVMFATVILVIWATAQLFKLAFGTDVDPWLNGIMGAVAGFFFGDGVIESMNKNKK